MKVLVFPCGSEIGLEVARASIGVKDIKLVGVSSIDDHGRYAFRDYRRISSSIDHSACIHEINAIVESEAIDLIYPAHDSVIFELTRRQREFRASLVASSWQAVYTTRSKLRTYQRFSGIIPTPEVYGVNPPGYPVFVKPEEGQGSKGAMKVNSSVELMGLMAQDPSRIVLEYLPGEEYTVDCFTDRHRKLRFVGVRKRRRVLNGISVSTERAIVPELEEMAGQIHRELTFRGAWFFQVKRSDQGEFKLLEVAPRIAGSSALHRILGVNLPVLTIYDQMGFDVQIACHSWNAELDRAWSNRYRVELQYDHVYLDFDDCLVIDGRLNELVMRFVVQARNEGKQLHILSRHQAGPLTEKLRDLRVLDVFDEVLQIDATTCKSKFIRPNSIFIDDSFAERTAVAACNIPVFSVDAVECLLMN